MESALFNSTVVSKVVNYNLSYVQNHLGANSEQNCFITKILRLIMDFFCIPIDHFYCLEVILLRN